MRLRGHWAARLSLGGKAHDLKQHLRARERGDSSRVERWGDFDHIAAYTAALELAVIALVTLFLMNLFHPRKDH